MEDGYVWVWCEIVFGNGDGFWIFVYDQQVFFGIELGEYVMCMIVMIECVIQIMFVFDYFQVFKDLGVQDWQVYCW